MSRVMKKRSGLEDINHMDMRKRGSKSKEDDINGDPDFHDANPEPAALSSNPDLGKRSQEDLMARVIKGDPNEHLIARIIKSDPDFTPYLLLDQEQDHNGFGEHQYQSAQEELVGKALEAGSRDLTGRIMRSDEEIILKIMNKALSNENENLVDTRQRRESLGEHLITRVMKSEPELSLRQQRASPGEHLIARVMRSEEKNLRPRRESSGEHLITRVMRADPEHLITRVMRSDPVVTSRQRRESSGEHLITRVMRSDLEESFRDPQTSLITRAMRSNSGKSLRQQRASSSEHLMTRVMRSDPEESNRERRESLGEHLITRVMRSDPGQNLFTRVLRSQRARVLLAQVLANRATRNDHLVARYSLKIEPKLFFVSFC